MQILKSFYWQINYSVDEIIIPYYGSQFMTGKPSPFGFKLWLLCSSDVHAEPYCCSITDLQETGLGQGPDVVVGFVDNCKLKKSLQQLWIIHSHIVTTAG